MQEEGTPGKTGRGTGKARSWNKEDDKKLERLFKNGDIDSNSEKNLKGDDYRQYLHEKSVEYFPEVSKNKANNIKRMQNKLRAYLLNKTLTGIRRGAKAKADTSGGEESKFEFPYHYFAFSLFV